MLHGANGIYRARFNTTFSNSYFSLRHLTVQQCGIASAEFNQLEYRSTLRLLSIALQWIIRSIINYTIHQNPGKSALELAMQWFGVCLGLAKKDVFSP